MNFPVKPSAENAILSSALELADIGKVVFPCKGDKRPHTPHGFKDATADPATIRTWWQSWPDAMIGLPTGSVNEIVVVDLDTKGGVDGIANFKALCPDGVLPKTLTFSTPSGGLHLYFRAPPEQVKCSLSKLAPGVDIKGEGGYVIAAPSFNESGRYDEVVSTDEPLEEPPPWLLERLVVPVSEADYVTESIEAISSLSTLSDPSSLSDLSVLSMTVEEVIAKTLPVREGQRNDCIMDFARGLKFNVGNQGRSLPELKPVVKMWHDRALPVIGTKDFHTTWSDFAHAWGRARHPLGALLTQAFERAKREPPPSVATVYGEKPSLLVALCWQLSRLEPQGVFFLAMGKAGELLGEQGRQIGRWLEGLIADGVLKLEKKGNERVANRYRWMWKETEVPF